jgi:hypothetical protein
VGIVVMKLLAPVEALPPHRRELTHPSCLRPDMKPTTTASAALPEEDRTGSGTSIR